MAADAALGNSTASMSLLDVGVDSTEFPQHANPCLKIALVLQADSVEARWQSPTGRTMRDKVAAGSTSVMPAEMPYQTVWKGGGRMLLLTFSPDFLGARDAALGKAFTELRPAWSQSDPLLQHLGLSILEAQRRQLASLAYMDSAAEVAMVHLLLRYGGGHRNPPDDLLPTGIATVLALIEERLGEDLSHARLAAAAGVSAYGFARAFTKAVGEPPHRYVQRRRCERAMELLRRTRASIAEIAAHLGFCSQAHLTTSFLRHAGTTPARYRAGSI